jgi:hypothetical protein
MKHLRKTILSESIPPVSSPRHELWRIAADSMTLKVSQFPGGTIEHDFRDRLGTQLLKKSNSAATVH